MPDSKPMQYRVIDRMPVALGAERSEVIAGLLENPARISPKYFYDELGCALYGAICRLVEYYPTRTELEVFREHRAEIAAAAGQGRQLVDLGAGDCCKAQSWLPYLNPTRYVAVDIAAPEIERSLGRMAPDHPDIEMLIGVDGKKAKPALDAAYDDALGVTAAFNRNVLAHLNRRFGFDFAIEHYAHRGFYNESFGRIEMHLEALRDQAVDLGGEKRRFTRGERIHTENSYKYGGDEFERLLSEAGFRHVRRWSSAQTPYFVFYAS